MAAPKPEPALQALAGGAARWEDIPAALEGLSPQHAGALPMAPRGA